MAVHNLTLGDDQIIFNARFGGKPTDIFVPTGAVLAIYAKENGQGMMFTEEPGGPDLPPDGTDDHNESPKPKLHVVK